MRLIRYEDADLVTKFYSEIGYKGPRVTHLKRELYQRDVLGCADHSVFMFGIFKEDRLIGVSDGGLQKAHGFVINNCVVTSILPEYESEALYQYAFKFVTNAALEKGALPVDDFQIPNTTYGKKRGAFCSTDFGYQTVTNVCTLK